MTAPDRWVLLRGLAREARHWHDFPTVLAAAVGVGSGAVECPDLPGMGTREACRAPASLEHTAADVARRTGAGPVALVGISLGGMVALEWARLDPANVSLVVAITPSDRQTAAPWRRLRPRAVALGARIAVARSPRRREELAMELISARPDGDRQRQLTAVRAAWTAQRKPRSTVVVRQLWASARWRAAEVPVPVLVLGAAGDEMVHPDCSPRLARRLGAELAMHPWAGHEVTIDDPDWVADRIARWLASLC